VAFSVTREFGPLITGILVAGRSGSALAARLSTMTINQEVDALRVMGVDPVRFLVEPALVAALGRHTGKEARPCGVLDADPTVPLREVLMVVESFRLAGVGELRFRGTPIPEGK